MVVAVVVAGMRVGRRGIRPISVMTCIVYRCRVKNDYDEGTTDSPTRTLMSESPRPTLFVDDRLFDR